MRKLNAFFETRDTIGDYVADSVNLESLKRALLGQDRKKVKVKVTRKAINAEHSCNRTP